MVSVAIVSVTWEGVPPTVVEVIVIPYDNVVEHIDADWVVHSDSGSSEYVGT